MIPWLEYFFKLLIKKITFNAEFLFLFYIF